MSSLRTMLIWMDALGVFALLVGVAISSLLALLPGVALLLLARRGRRVGEHPHCRRCEYNLSGGPEAKACPECGSDLALPRAVVIGERRARPLHAAIGAGLLLLALGLGGSVMYAQMQSFDWNTIKPAWLLIREMPDSSSARRELAARIKNKAITPAEVTRIVHVGLDWQGDLTKPWLTDWGDLIEEARRVQMVSEEDWNRYVRQAPGPMELQIRPRLERGQPISFQFGNRRNRVAGVTVLQFRYEIGEIDVDGRGMNSGRARDVWKGLQFASPKLVTFTLPWEECADDQVKPGEHQWQVAYRVFGSEGLGRRESDVTHWDLAVQARATVLPEGQSAVTPIRDEILLEPMQRSLSMEEVRFDHKGHDCLAFRLLARRPPAPGVFDVVARSGSQEWTLTTIFFEAKEENSWSIGGKCAGYETGPIQVILRPNAKAAERHISQSGYWAEEIDMGTRYVPAEPPHER